MDGLRIIPVTNIELVYSLSTIADEIWREYFPAIIGEAIDIIVLLAYITLQIYYSVEYHVSWYSVGMNILVAGLIFC